MPSRAASSRLNWTSLAATALAARKNVTAIDWLQINGRLLRHRPLVIPSITVMSDVAKFIRKCQWANLYTTRFARHTMASDSARRGGVAALSARSANAARSSSGGISAARATGGRASAARPRLLLCRPLNAPEPGLQSVIVSAVSAADLQSTPSRQIY